MTKRIVLVGHCNVDGPRLQELFSAGVPGSQVLRVNSDADLEREFGREDSLFLVNREPVGFKDSGMSLIRQVQGQSPSSKVMLVSDHPEAQEQAEAAGALPGFGKSQIESPEVLEKVKTALGV